MKPQRLQRWWEGAAATILVSGASRDPGTNTVGYAGTPDADLVWDPADRTETPDGCLRAVIGRRGPDKITLLTGCSCGAYDILDPVALHHHARPIDAMAELAAKAGASEIRIPPGSELDDRLAAKILEAGIAVREAGYAEMQESVASPAYNEDVDT